MKRNTMFVVLAVAALFAGGYFGYQRYTYIQGRNRAREAEAAIRARLAQPASDTDAPVSVMSGAFLKLAENLITLRVPETVQVDGSTFINYREWTATIYNETNVFRYSPAPASPNGVTVEPYQVYRIQPGAQVVVYYRENAGGPQASAIHILY